MAGEATRFEQIAGWFEGLRKAILAIAAVAAGIIVAAAIVREVAMGGIVIDPVAVKASDKPEAPTPEMAAQQIARQLDRIQRAGVKEWRKAYVDDGVNPVDLQIPGSPLSLRGVVREVVALFGLTPVTLRSALTRRAQPPGYLAVISLAGDHGSTATCEAEDSAWALDEIYECIAVNAMSFIDPKVAASYMFKVERAQCKDLDADTSDVMSDLEREEYRIHNRRERCSFEKTQSLIARVMAAGNEGDLPWVPYIYGQVHLARAKALAGVALEQQLSELDQAIGRFLDAQGRMPDSSATIAILLRAYLTKGIAIDQSTSKMDWDDDPESPMQARLTLAERTFADAKNQLDRIPVVRSTRLDAVVNRLEGLLLYRNWMILAHRREKSEVSRPADYPDEIELLVQAAAKFKSADAEETTSTTSLMQWGNILRAQGLYEEAIEKYRRAADLDPTNREAVLNIAAAYIDRVEFESEIPDTGHLLDALGALSGYLAWMSPSQPDDGRLMLRVAGILGRTGDEPAFEECLKNTRAASGSSDPDIGKWEAAGTFKFCVDKATERASSRAVRVAEAF